MRLPVSGARAGWTALVVVTLGAVAGCGTSGTSGTGGTGPAAPGTKAAVGSTTSGATPATTWAGTTTTSTGTGTTAASAPTTTATGGSATTVSTDPTCTFGPARLRLTYPAGWHTNGAPEPCALFDPDPFTVPEQSEAPTVAVMVAKEESAFDPAAERLRSSPSVRIDAERPTTLGGRPAICFTMISNGMALLETGTRTYLCLVDFGDSAVAFQNIRLPGLPDKGYDAEVRRMAERATPLP